MASQHEELGVDVGARIGRFVIVRALGAGGMSTVYEARDPELERSVALKLIRDRDPQLTVRLLREAQVLAQLQHPNVVAVHELDVHDDQAFIAMELVDGETLDRHLARSRPGWRGVVGLFVQVGRGLAAAHAKGIVHRDVKPSNLFVDGAGRVRVGDFGLARVDVEDGGEAAGPVVVAAARPAARSSPSASDATEPDDTLDVRPPRAPSRPSSKARSAGRNLMRSPITRLGAVLGTPYFMAPEQHRGRRATAATDQFSFCVALWLALYGEHPFAIDGDIAEAVIVGRRRPVPRARVPRAVARIVERGLAVDPDARHPSMESLVAALERALRRPRWPYAAAAVAVLGAAVAIAVVGGRPGPQADARTPVAIRHATAPLFRIASALAGQDVATAGDALFDGFAASDDPAHLLDAMRVYYRAGRCDGAVRAQQAYAVAMRGAPMPPDDVRLELIEIHRDCSVPYLATNDLAELDRLAMRYAARADLSGAIATLKRMRELEPDAAQRARYMLRIGDYALGHGKCKSAEAAYEIYLKELPAESTPPSEAARLQAQLARCVPSDPE